MEEAVNELQVRSAEQVIQGFHDRLDLGPVGAGIQRLPPGTAVKQLPQYLDLLLEQSEGLVDRGSHLLLSPVPVGVVPERGL